MKLQRTDEIIITQFRANMYKHVSTAHFKKCWQCRADFKIGDEVNVILTTSGNNTLCTSCAKSAGLLDMVDERDFVDFEKMESAAAN